VRSLIYVLMVLTSCAGSKSSQTKAAEIDFERCVPLVERCELEHDKGICDAALVCVDLAETAQLMQAAWDKCRATADVDMQECAGKVAKLSAELAHEKVLKWRFGAGGVGIGAVLAVLFVLLI